MNARVSPQTANVADIQRQNAIARDTVLSRSVDMKQQIFTGTIAAANVRNTVLNVPVRNVGLIKRFIVEVSGAIVQAAAETLTRTAFNGANIFSQIVFTDLSNNTRIQTTGWHMHLLACARRQQVFGAAYTTDSPVLIGANTNVMTIPSPVTTTQNFRFFYEIPISYSDFDLRGSIYAGVVNATMNLQLTVNPNFVVASTGNPTEAVYISSSTDLGTINNFTVTVYQQYLDQLPMTNQGPILPLMDLSTVYLLNNTVASAMVVNQDFSVPFANFRDFMSTIAIYDNFGGSAASGAELNYIALQSANYTNIWKMDPYALALQTRNIIGDDFPAQAARYTYYIDTRMKPITTIQYGNMELVWNFAAVQASTSALKVGYEALALQNQITQAGSLYNT